MSTCKYCGFESDKYYCPSCGLKKKSAEVDETDIVRDLETIKKEVDLNSENIFLLDYVRLIQCNKNLELIKTDGNETVEIGKKQISRIINRYKKATRNLIEKEISKENKLEAQENIKKVKASFIGKSKEKNVEKEVTPKRKKNPDLEEDRDNSNKTESTEDKKNLEENNKKRSKYSITNNDLNDISSAFADFNIDSVKELNYVPKNNKKTEPVSEKNIEMMMRPKGASITNDKKADQEINKEEVENENASNSPQNGDLKGENRKRKQEPEEKQKLLRNENHAKFIQITNKNNLGNNLFVDEKNDNDLTGILNDDDNLIKYEDIKEIKNDFADEEQQQIPCPNGKEKKETCAKERALFQEIPGLDCTVDTEKNLFEEIEIPVPENTKRNKKRHKPTNQKKQSKKSKKKKQDKKQESAKKQKVKKKKSKSNYGSKKNTLKIKRGQKIVIIDPSKGEEYDGYYDDVEVQGNAETTFEFGVISGNVKFLIGMGIVALLGAILIIKSILGIIG